MSNEENILELLQTMQMDMTVMKAELKDVTARMDKLEEGQARRKADLQTGIKASEGRMIALTEGHFDKNFGLLADGHALLLEQMVKKKDLEEAMQEVRIEIGLIKAVSMKNARDIEELKKAQ